MNVLEFWEVTPKEFEIVADAFMERMKTEQNEKITLAYMTAAWAAQWFSKRQPEPLEKILGKAEKSEQKKMTPEEILKTVMAQNMALGGEINGSS